MNMFSVKCLAMVKYQRIGHYKLKFRVYEKEETAFYGDDPPPETGLGFGGWSLVEVPHETAHYGIVTPNWQGERPDGGV